MKRFLALLMAVMILLALSGCATTQSNIQVAATTLPVFEFTTRLCAGTDITVTQLITESVSCLHDYSLQVSQMRAIEQAQLIVVSGAGLEAFMDDVLNADGRIIDASVGITLLCAEHDHEHGHDHVHNNEHDPHIWLSPNNAGTMAKNICDGLCDQYPQHSAVFQANLLTLQEELDELQAYGAKQLASLSSRELITFHDGFAYLAQAYDLSILHVIEEESGREASAAELIDLCRLVTEHDLPAIFTERHGSNAAASVISRETEAKIYQLDMAMGDSSYFDAMYHNIDTLKEALE